MIKKYIKKIIKIIILFILMIIIFYNFLNINNTKGFTRIFNYKIAVVQEYQEQKNVEKNSLIILKDIKRNYQIGDLIMINTNNSLYFHSVVDIDDNKYTTKGEGNYRPNREIEINNIEGKVIKQIPRIGPVFDFFASKFVSFIILAILIFLVFYNKHIYKKKIYRRIKQKQEN